ncbi:hypothetical protein J6590_103397 [Homalodisca vitripennis]|nr:hypothetical protein J6590_070989 [Homalodisca vitripennis]KAG8279516.1 hypothetical protein J6590_103397 [Homalodisca vitripennis]
MPRSRFNYNCHHSQGQPWRLIVAATMGQQRCDCCITPGCDRPGVLVIDSKTNQPNSPHIPVYLVVGNPGGMRELDREILNQQCQILGDTESGLCNREGVMLLFVNDNLHEYLKVIFHMLNWETVLKPEKTFHDEIPTHLVLVERQKSN